jgi:hypothetical protein
MIIGFIEHLYPQLQVTIALSLIHTFCSLLQHVRNLLSLLYLHRLSPDNGLQSVASSASVFTSLLAGDWLTTNSLLQLTHKSRTLLTAISSLSRNQSQTHIATDGQSVSKSWCHLLLFDSYGLVFLGVPFLRRGRVCLLYMLLVPASVVFLGPESLGTRDHILLSQIWDFNFRRLLRLAGSRWRYSNPLHAVLSLSLSLLLVI